MICLAAVYSEQDSVLRIIRTLLRPKLALFLAEGSNIYQNELAISPNLVGILQPCLKRREEFSIQVWDTTNGDIPYTMASVNTAYPSPELCTEVSGHRCISYPSCCRELFPWEKWAVHNHHLCFVLCLMSLACKDFTLQVCVQQTATE